MKEDSIKNQTKDQTLCVFKLDGNLSTKANNNNNNKLNQFSFNKRISIHSQSMNNSGIKNQYEKEKQLPKLLLNKDFYEKRCSFIVNINNNLKSLINSNSIDNIKLKQFKKIDVDNKRLSLLKNQPKIKSRFTINYNRLDHINGENGILQNIDSNLGNGLSNDDDFGRKSVISFKHDKNEDDDINDINEENKIINLNESINNINNSKNTSNNISENNKDYQDENSNYYDSNYNMILEIQNELEKYIEENSILKNQLNQVIIENDLLKEEADKYIQKIEENYTKDTETIKSLLDNICELKSQVSNLESDIDNKNLNIKILNQEIENLTKENITLTSCANAEYKIRKTSFEKNLSINGETTTMNSSHNLGNDSNRLKTAKSVKFMNLSKNNSTSNRIKNEDIKDLKKMSLSITSDIFSLISSNKNLVSTDNMDKHSQYTLHNFEEKDLNCIYLDTLLDDMNVGNSENLDCTCNQDNNRVNCNLSPTKDRKITFDYSNNGENIKLAKSYSCKEIDHDNFKLEKEKNSFIKNTLQIAFGNENCFFIKNENSASIIKFKDNKDLDVDKYNLKINKLTLQLTEVLNKNLLLEEKLIGLRKVK